MVLQEVGCFQEPVYIHTSHSIFSWSQQLDALRLRPTFFQKAISNTPLIKLNPFSAETSCTVSGKSEFQNPGGSVKNRAALYVVKDAEERGLLKPGRTVVEGTAGNIGIRLSGVCRSRGYKLAIYMPTHSHQGKIDLLRLLGAEVYPRSCRSVGGQPELQLADEETCGATAKAGLLKDQRRLFTSSPSLYPDSSPRLSHVQPFSQLQLRHNARKGPSSLFGVRGFKIPHDLQRQVALVISELQDTVGWETASFANSLTPSSNENLPGSRG
jgi:hypothetical protein